MPQLSRPCPRCATIVQVDVRWSGLQVTCPHCQHSFTVTTGAERLPPAPAGLEADLADLLPPPARQHSPKPEDIADLLPPGASPAGPTIPIAAEPADLLPPTVAGQNLRDGLPPNVLPTAAAPVVVVSPVVRSVTRQQPAPVKAPALSPAERAQRRFQRNIIMWAVCILVLTIAFYLLSR